MLEAPHAHDCRQRLWEVRMIVDADEMLARADGEETLRAARRKGYDPLHSGAQQERSGQIVHREARTGEKRGTLAQAPPGFGRARPRKDFRMDGYCDEPITESQREHDLGGAW